jgi:hypothetical protein
MGTALSFPNGRHFFFEDGALKLLIAKTKLTDGRVAELENRIRFCPFCGKPIAPATAG